MTGLSNRNGLSLGYRLSLGAGLSLGDGLSFSGARSFSFVGSGLPVGATLTRASTGWYFDSSVSLTSAAVDVARFTYDPAGTGLQGLLVEPAATNSVPNASAGGAVPGTPGTAPNNWAVSGIINAVTRTIVGSGTENGVPYVDIRYVGTPSATSSLVISPEASGVVAAVAGQSWAGQMYLRLVGGAFTNLLAYLQFVTFNNVGGVTDINNGPVINPTTAALKAQQFGNMRTLIGATTVSVIHRLVLEYTIGLAIDVTVRVGLPQLVQAPAASSPIVTTSAAVTRAADVLSLAMPNGTYNIDITRVSGVTNLTGVVVTGGTYAVSTDPSPLRNIATRRTA